MKKNNKKGFTLVELVIVVAVMAILVAVAIPTISSITGEAQANVNSSNAQTIESMIKLAEAESTLSDKVVAKAIVDAKLGIEGSATATKRFFYDTDTGLCSSVTAAQTGKNGYNIAFDGSTEAGADAQVGVTVTAVTKTTTP